MGRGYYNLFIRYVLYYLLLSIHFRDDFDASPRPPFFYFYNALIDARKEWNERQARSLGARGGKDGAKLGRLPKENEAWKRGTLKTLGMPPWGKEIKFGYEWQWLGLMPADLDTDIVVSRFGTANYGTDHPRSTPEEKLRDGKTLIDRYVNALSKVPLNDDEDKFTCDVWRVYSTMIGRCLLSD